jgi:hypothetical protein
MPPCGHCELQAIRAVGRAGDPLERMNRQNEFFKETITELDESRNALFQELNVGRMESNHSFNCTSGLSLSKLHATTAAHSPMHCQPALPSLCIVATWSLAEETESELTADEFVINYPKPTHSPMFG